MIQGQFKLLFNLIFKFMKSKLLLQLIMLSKNAFYGILLQTLLFNFIWAADTNAQEVKSVNNVEVNLDLKDATLIDVFRKIESQTNFVFSYINEELNRSYRFTRNYKNATLSKVLLEISRDANLKFKQVNNNINVSALGDKVPEEKIEVIIQTRNITGKVTSYEDNEGLPGVNVVEKGSSNGTVTDVQGNYSLEVSEGATLVFSSVGYTPEEVEVGNRSVVDLTMTQDIQQLQELVVVGFGTQEKRELTGSIVRANIDDFRESPNVNIAQSLQGTVPGLNIGMVDEAGGNPSISIRGATTLSGNQDVLIVLDGIIFTGSLSDLNPNDIGSIDVLKDASSMAIYGAQAANGVILITSKEGKRSDKPIFNYTGSYTTQNPIENLTKQNRDQHIQKVRDYDWRNGYLAPDYIEINPDWDILPNLNTAEVAAGYANGTEYDWWDNITKPGFINAHDLSVSGSQGNFTYFIAGGYTKQKGYIINDEFERKSIRINLSNQILDWLKIGAQTFGSFSDYSGASPTLNDAIINPDLVGPYDENGELIINPNGTNSNPFIPTLADDFDKRNSLFGNFYLDLDIPFIKGLNYRLNYGHNYGWDRRYQSNEFVSNTRNGMAFKRFTNQYDWTLDHILSYKKVFNEVHRVDITLVAGQRELIAEDFLADGENYSSTVLGYNDLSLGGVQRIESGGWDESYLYQTARINYEFNYKYLLTATIRRDGFSGFAENEKFGIFPSIGLGWIISEEPFLDTESINNLKIRASYGTNGNLVNRYASLARLNLYPAYVAGDGGSTLFGQEVTSLANPNLSWETTTGLNLGLDFSLFNNRFSGSIDYYNTTTNDLIFAVNIPEITGFEEITTNIGEIANQGIELNLNGDIVRNDDFTWNLNFNIASNNNKIQSLIGLDTNGDGREDDLTASGLFIGESINSIFTYESEGIIQLGEDTPSGFFEGTHRIVDQNNDEIIDPLDRVIIGREEPAYQFGILNRLNYKNFEFRFFINSIQGGKNGYLGRNMPGNGFGNPVRGAFNEYDFWSPANSDAIWRAPLQSPATEFIQYMDRSFVRLQDVTLAYTFDKGLVNSLGMNNIRLFVSGKNLLTLSDWIGWDPETGAGLSTGDRVTSEGAGFEVGRPVLRGFSIGLDLSF